jgi:hypothetical protein
MSEGDRFYVGRYSTKWAVFDLAYNDSEHLYSTHADEFDAILACQKANAGEIKPRKVRRTRGAR